MEGSEDVSFAVYNWGAKAGESPTYTAYVLNTNWRDEEPKPAEAKLLWKETKVPHQIAPGKLSLIALQRNWEIGTRMLKPILPESRQAKGLPESRCKAQEKPR